MTYLKRPWCWKRLKARGKGDDRRWDGWMASPTQWTWVWVSSRSLWWAGRPGVLQFMGSQRVGHDWATELNWYTVYDHDREAVAILWYVLRIQDAERLGNFPQIRLYVKSQLETDSCMSLADSKSYVLSLILHCTHFQIFWTSLIWKLQLSICVYSNKVRYVC